MMLSLDGAEAHRCQRAPFAEAYQPRRLRRLHSEGISELVASLISQFAARGKGELMSEFCDPLAIISVTQVLGLPLANLDQFRAWYDDIAAALANFTRDEEIRARGRAATQAFGAEIRAHLQRLADAPDESALSAITLHPQHHLDEDAIVANTILTIFGGRETTAAMLGNTIWALLQHPAQLAALRADWSLLPNALEEALRWEAPVQTATRHVTRPTTLLGVDWNPAKWCNASSPPPTAIPTISPNRSALISASAGGRSPLLRHRAALLPGGAAGADGGADRACRLSSRRCRTCACVTMPGRLRQPKRPLRWHAPTATNSAGRRLCIVAGSAHLDAGALAHGRRPGPASQRHA